jgi:WD40 repeat protein
MRRLFRGRGGGRARADTPILCRHPGVHSVFFSPDGVALATSSSGPEMVLLWDAATGQQRAKLTFRYTRKPLVVFSPDGATLATGATATFSPDSTMMTTDDDRVRLLDVATGQLRARFPKLDIHQGIRTMAFSPDGATLATGGDTVRLWDVAAGRQRAVHDIHRVDPQNLRRAMGPGALALVDEYQRVDAVAFSPDGATLASSGGPATRPRLMLWDIAAGRQRAVLDHSTDRFWFTPDSATLVFQTPGAVWFVDVATGRQRAKLTPTSQGPTTALSPDGATLVTSEPTSWDGTGGVRLWDVATAEQRARLDIREANSMAFSPDSTTLATSYQGVLELWDVATGQRRVQLTPGGRVTYHPDGTLISVDGQEGTVRLRNDAAQSTQ